MDAYGALLTDKQREFMRLHYEEDLSFGEIAKDHGVSRQAIHDAVKHAEHSLEEYEGRMGLLKRGRGGDATLNGAAREVTEVLQGTIKKLRGSGVIYSADWIVTDLRRALSLLHAEESDEHAANGEESAG
jgi:hypothetical protein